MARYLYSELSKAIQARKNCANKMEDGANESIVQNAIDWHQKWSDHIDTLMEQMPSGSGFDNGTSIDLDASHAEKLVFNTSFHHMDEAGDYDGWTEAHGNSHSVFQRL